MKIIECEKYFGKYRGKVLNNIDPEQRGRLLVEVPDVLGPNISSWAMPCLPMAGPQMGVYVVPIIGAGVWVEFEGGNPDYPLCTGGFWGSAKETPSLARNGIKASPNIVLQTSGQHSIVVSDLPGPEGGIMLISPKGASIIVNDTGIYINNGNGTSIVMTGNTVNINDGALVIK